MKFDKFAKAMPRTGRPHRLKLLDAAVLAALALAGYRGATGWLILLGGGALAIEASWGTLWGKSAREGLRPTLTKKVTAFLVTGAVAGLTFAALAYALGALVAALLGR